MKRSESSHKTRYNGTVSMLKMGKKENSRVPSFVSIFSTRAFDASDRWSSFSSILAARGAVQNEYLVYQHWYRLDFTVLTVGFDPILRARSSVWLQCSKQAWHTPSTPSMWLCL